MDTFFAVGVHLFLSKKDYKIDYDYWWADEEISKYKAPLLYKSLSVDKQDLAGCRIWLISLSSKRIRIKHLLIMSW
jgi:hypothetical protein